VIASEPSHIRPQSTSERVSVLFLKEGTDLYGAEKATLRLLRRLDFTRLDVNVAIMDPASGASAFTRAVQDLGTPLRLIQIPAAPGAALRAFRAVTREINPQAVVTVGYKCDIIGKLALTGLSPFTASVLHGWASTDWKARLYYRVDKLFFRYFDGLFAVSEGLLETARALSSTGQTACIYNGVDPGELTKLSHDPLPAGIDESSELIVFAGRLVKEKGVWCLLEAFKRLGRPATLCLAGGGPLRQELEAWAVSNGLAGRVMLPGEVKNVCPLLRRAAVVVLPSIINEGLPLIVLEAMALGKPVVASDQPWSSGVLQDGINGLLVPSGDPVALAAMLDRVLANREMADRLGSAARGTIMEKFTEETVARRFETHLLSWLGK